MTAASRRRIGNGGFSAHVDALPIASGVTTGFLVSTHWAGIGTRLRSSGCLVGTSVRRSHSSTVRLVG